jgi:hypothetical protein
MMKTAFVTGMDAGALAESAAYRALQLKEADAVLQAMVLPGRTPREHLEWLLDTFVFADLTSLTPTERGRLGFKLQSVILSATADAWSLSSGTFQMTDVETVQKSTTAAAKLTGVRREVVASFPSGRKASPPALHQGVVTVPLAEVLLTQGVLRGVAHALAGGGGVRVNLNVEASAYPGGRIFFATMTSALFVALTTLLERIAPVGLRQCAFADCQRVFVPRKRQRWCAEHKVEIRKKQLGDAQKRTRQKRTLRARRGRRRPPRVRGERRRRG